MAHKLMTAEVIKRMPGPRAQENAEDPIVYAKFFSCRNGWTWYAYEAWNVIVNAETGEFIDERALKEPLKPGEKIEETVFFGRVDGFESELGPFTLQEFEEVNKKYRGGLLAVERDIHFEPKPLSSFPVPQRH